MPIIFSPGSVTERTCNTTIANLTEKGCLKSRHPLSISVLVENELLTFNADLIDL